MPVIVLLVHLVAFSILENKLVGYADDSILMDIVPSPGVIAKVAGYMNREHCKVSEWCDF